AAARAGDFRDEPAWRVLQRARAYRANRPSQQRMAAGRRERDDRQLNRWRRGSRDCAGNRYFCRYARRTLERCLIEQALAKISGEIAEQAKKADLPENLRQRLKEAFREHPELSWDVVVSAIIRRGFP